MINLHLGIRVNSATSKKLSLREKLSNLITYGLKMILSDKKPITGIEQ